MKVLVTGGCGFIGSNFINYLLTDTEIKRDFKIVNLDKQTYAGQGKNIEYMGFERYERYRLVKGDTCNKRLVRDIFENEKPEFVFNFAAESHVDRSIEDTSDFARTNILGTANLIDCAKNFPLERFIHISTDEVYGSIENGSFKEDDSLKPSNPYSISKAAAEQLVESYFKRNNVPTIITRSANNYGPYQFPEKILPLFITNLIQEKKVPLMWSKENPGLNVRDWLHVRDNCRAIYFLSQKGEKGEIYNIPGRNEKTNLEMTKMLLNFFNYGEEMIEKIPHRKSHDFRYSINGDKLNSLGFRYEHHGLESELGKVCNWYKENKDWWSVLKK